MIICVQLGLFVREDRDCYDLKSCVVRQLVGRPLVILSPTKLMWAVNDTFTNLCSVFLSTYHAVAVAHFNITSIFLSSTITFTRV